MGKPNDNFNDRDMFSQMDELSQFLYEDDRHFDILECDIYQEDNEIDMNRVKDKTFDKLGINKPKKRFRLNKAAAMIVITVAVGACVLTDVSAQIEKLFQYIPGVNRMVETEETPLLVLGQPVKKEHIELVSVVVDNRKNEISVSARGTGGSPDHVSARLSNGKVIPLPLGGVGGSGDAWNGHYFNNKKVAIEIGEQESITIQFDDVEIPVSLVKADEIANQDELGVTTTVNDMKITAVKDIVGDDLTIYLLSSKKQGQRIDAFGLPPDYEEADDYRFKGILNEKITLKDQEGNILESSSLDLYSGPLSEFNFKLGDKLGEKLVLSIPFLKIDYDIEKTVDVPLPKVGEKQEYDDFRIDTGDFYMDIQGVERTKKDEVVIDFDVHYNEEEEESLYEVNFAPTFGKRWDEEAYYGYSMEYAGYGDVEEGMMILGELDKLYIQLEVQDLETLLLHIKRITTVKRGPWEFEIDCKE